MGRRPEKNVNLPKYMRARKQRSGVIYYYYDCGGKPRVEIPLGTNYVEAVQKWAELEGNKAIEKPSYTYKDAVERYMRDVIPFKSPKSQEGNLSELKPLNLFFHDAPLDEIDPIHIRQYFDYRKNAPVAANREISLLSHIFNMAREWGMTKLANPCSGVKKNSETGRKHVYIENNVFDAVYGRSDQPTRDALDLAYLTAQRPCDVVKMTDHHIKDGQIEVLQNKGKHKLRIEVMGELKALIFRIDVRKAGLPNQSIKLIVNERGLPLTQGALMGRFEKARKLAIEDHPELAEQIANFQFRDIRAKAGTDKAESSKDIRQAQKQLGHSTVVMTEQYLRQRKGDKVEPTK